MKESDQNQGCLKWTNTDSRLSAETFGHPAREIEMDCHICTMQGEKIVGKQARGLWDTGTSTTVITPEIAAKLHLQPKGSMNVNGLGGAQQAWRTVCYFRFPNGKFFGPLVVAVHELPSVDVLIGMDIISIGKLAIERKPDNGTLFTFDINP